MVVIYKNHASSSDLVCAEGEARGSHSSPPFLTPSLPPCIAQSVDDGEEYWQELTAIQRRGGQRNCSQYAN